MMGLIGNILLLSTTLYFLLIIGNIGLKISTGENQKEPNIFLILIIATIIEVIRFFI